MNMMFVFDSNKKLIGFLSNNGANPIAPFFYDLFKQDLNTGADTYEFTTINNSYTSRIIKPGNYVLFFYDEKYKMFQIVEQKHEHNSGKKHITSYCEGVGLELLTDYAEPFTIEGNFRLFLETVLQDTEWRVGNISDSLLHKTSLVKNTKKEKVYKLIQDNISTFGVELEFRIEFFKNKVVGMYIDAYQEGERGRRTYKRFEYGDNVISISKKVNIYDFASAGIGEGQDGIDFKDVEWKKSKGDPTNKPLGQDFVVNHIANDSFNKGKKYIKKTYNFNTKDKRELLRLTYDALLLDGEPKTDYEVNLGLRSEEYKHIRIGDTVYVLDFDYFPAVMLEARVGVLEISFTDPRKNKCTLSNYKEVQSKMKSFSKEDIMSEVLEFISNLKVGMLDEVTINQLETYMKQMGVEKSEIDKIVEELNKIANEQLEEEQRNKVHGEYIDILINDSTRKYICSVVKSLKFRLPSKIPSGFSTTLEFTTEKDTAPTKFFQDINCWCDGVDCWNGGLVPHADTTYTIVLTQNKDANIIQKYKGKVTKVSHGGSYRSYENKTSYVEKVREVMQSYYHVRDKFIYNTITPFSFKDPTTSTNKAKWKTNGKFHIDCSTFVHFVIRGITYEQSIYAIPSKSPYFLSNKYDYSFVLDASISDRDRFASDMARACIEQGWQLDIDMTNRANWKKLRAGDIVFWAKRYGEESFEFKERYMRVGHVAIVSSVLEDGDVTTYESTSGLNNSILNRRLSVNYPEKILFVARPRR